MMNGAVNTVNPKIIYARGSALGTKVFTLTLNGDGTYAFVLVNPLDHAAGQDENALILNLTNLVQAIDFDGDTIPLASGSFQIDVIDDVPVVVEQPPALKAAKTATETRRPAGGHCIVRKLSTENETAGRRRTRAEQ